MIEVFDSAEEMLRALRESREAADAHIRSWQREIRPGDKVLRMAPVDGSLLVIYGEILDVVETERPHYDLSDPEARAEFEFVCAQFGPEWQASYRFGRFYSPLCPEGELGDIHLATITCILTEDEFVEARVQHWPQARSPFLQFLHMLHTLAPDRS